MAITNPTDIANLANWTDASVTASITHTGGNVTAIAAQVGTNMASVVGTPVTGTRTLNGLNVIDFDGASRLKASSPAGPVGAVYTAFGVGKVDASTGGNQFLFSFQGTDSSGIVYVNGSNWGVNSANIIESGDAVDTDAHYFIYVCNGTSSRLWIDGVENTLTGDPGSNGYSADGVWGANAYDGALLNGFVGESGVYSRVLNSTELADLNAYMSEKWFGVGAATLSAGASSNVTQTTATVGATTDQNTGTLYLTLTDTASHRDTVTATQVTDGQQDSGAAAQLASSGAVTTTSPSIPLTGLTPGTTYYWDIAQENGNGISNLQSGSFTTAAASRTVTVQLRSRATGTLLNNVARRFWTRLTLSGAAVDGGADGLNVTCNASGQFVLTGLTIAAGAGYVTYHDPADNTKSINIPVTFLAGT